MDYWMKGIMLLFGLIVIMLIFGQADSAHHVPDRWLLEWQGYHVK